MDVESHKCYICPKIFIDEGFLKSHVERRHSTSTVGSGSGSSTVGSGSSTVGPSTGSTSTSVSTVPLRPFGPSIDPTPLCLPSFPPLLNDLRSLKSLDQGSLDRPPDRFQDRFQDRPLDRPQDRPQEYYSQRREVYYGADVRDSRHQEPTRQSLPMPVPVDPGTDVWMRYRKGQQESVGQILSQPPLRSMSSQCCCTCHKKKRKKIRWRLMRRWFHRANDESIFLTSTMLLNSHPRAFNPCLSGGEIIPPHEDQVQTHAQPPHRQPQGGHGQDHMDFYYNSSRASYCGHSQCGNICIPTPPPPPPIRDPAPSGPRFLRPRSNRSISGLRTRSFSRESTKQ